MFFRVKQVNEMHCDLGSRIPIINYDSQCYEGAPINYDSMYSHYSNEYNKADQSSLKYDYMLRLTNTVA